MLCLLALIFGNIAAVFGANRWTARKQKNAELRQWAPFKQNPVIDGLLRRYAGDLESPVRRKIADRIKKTTRGFVNSEAFSIAVDGALNNDSLVRESGKKLADYWKKRQNPSTFEPLPDEACTIH